MDENIIARNIRVLRAKKGWNQTQLAEQAGLSLRGIQAIENEGRDTRATNLISIAKALNVSVSEIVGETDGRAEKADLLRDLLGLLPTLNNDQLSRAIRFIRKDIALQMTMGTEKTKSRRS